MGGPAGSPIVLSGEPSSARTRQAAMGRMMVLLLLCFFVALAGCARLGGGGTVGGGPSGGKPDDPIGATPGTQEPPAGDGSVREDPDPTVFDARGAAIDHYTIGADGRTVVVYWWGGNQACFGLKEISVESVRGTPTVTVLEGTRESARGKACTMEAVLKSAVVVLDAPILADAANPDPERAEAIVFAGAERVSPVDGVTDARLHAVSGFVLSADGLTLSAFYVGGVDECYGLASATATSDGAAGPVTVRIREGWIAADGVACDDIGVPKVVQLRLDAPLIVAATFDSESGQPAS